MTNETRTREKATLTEILRDFLWRSQRVKQQLEYGLPQWVADTALTIESFPRYSGRSTDLFGEFDKSLNASGLMHDEIYSGHRFVRTFNVATNCWANKNGPVAFDYKQKRQQSEPDLGDQATHWLIGEHREDSAVEVTLRGLMQSDDENPSKERAWEFMLGLNYNGEDRCFVPRQPIKPSLGQLIYHRIGRAPLDDSSRTEKMPLLNQKYGATITQRGIQDFSQKVAETTAKLEVLDERLRPYAEEMFVLLNSMERGFIRGEKPEVAEIINGYRVKADKLSELAQESEKTGDLTKAIEYLMQREQHMRTISTITMEFIDSGSAHRYQRSYSNEEKDKKRLIELELARRGTSQSELATI